MIVPCPLCGYDAPGAHCPHCGLAPAERSLAGRGAGPVTGLAAGITALPRGLWILLSTRGVKRWLLPPLMLTATVLVAVLVAGWRWLGRAVGGALPDEVELAPPDWAWLEGLVERWEWIGSVVGGLVVASEWLVNTLYGLAANRVSGLVLYLLLGMLAFWYVFSIAYEAFAGPFLDEVQGRIEKRWFGTDPRDALQRPTDIPPERCFRLSVAALAVVCGLLLLGFLTPFPFWAALLLAPLPFLGGVLLDRRYGTWLAWVARIEGSAVWVGVKASLLTAVVLLFTWPVYFVPWVGYFLFAAICGFATALTLLDIPCERRGWSVRQRLGFVRRHLLAFTAFGVVAGFLLSVPVAGPVLMVPSASVGGLWLLCRLDKSRLRPATSPVPERRIPRPAGPGTGPEAT